MKLADAKAKLKIALDKQAALREEAKTLLTNATANGKEVSADEQKVIVAKQEESGRYASEINMYENYIKAEEGKHLPAGLRRNELAGLAGLDRDELEIKAPRSSHGTPRYFSGRNREEKREAAYRFGVYCAALARKGTPNNDWAIRKAKELFSPEALHQEDGMTAGSALVPEPLANEIIDLREYFGVFRQITRVMPMTSDTLGIPRRLTGLTYYWRGEAGAVTSSTKSWDRPMLVAKSLAALGVVTNELAEDAIISIADDLLQEGAYALASAEDDAGFLGDGTSGYGGITGLTNKLFNLSGTVSSIAGVQVTTGTGSYAGAVIADWNNFLGLLPLYADTPAAKIVTSRQYFFQNMQRLAIAAGGTTMTETIDGVRRQMFLGYPVVFSQKMPRFWATNQCVALFGDFGKGSKLGDRHSIQIRESEHATVDGVSLFTNCERAYLFEERIDINVHDAGNATSTAANKQAGPYVGMFTASS